MKKNKGSSYDRARRIACKGRHVALHDPQSRWELQFVPIQEGICREVALSVSGEVNIGFLWKWIQENDKEIFTPLPETRRQERDENLWIYPPKRKEK